LGHLSLRFLKKERPKRGIIIENKKTEAQEAPVDSFHVKKKRNTLLISGSTLLN